MTWPPDLQAPSFCVLFCLLLLHELGCNSLNMLVGMLVHRYGGEVAYGPHSINLVGPSVVVYISDRTSPIDFRLWVTDIAGQTVTAGQTFCHYAPDDMSSTCQRLPTVHCMVLVHVMPSNLLFGAD